ncbi:hypothetical protein CK203_061899 [Vitis vinifera]|uniref:Uncharacterized protein n=1 Tax=Vitis vinifera TaxID=29760 RepID=A0A438GCL6_VITVI|nr:hypothetical protein CK203_061899 [Vitis vinifera]
MIKNQFGVTIKGFRSDNNKDYFNQVLTPYFHHEGKNSIKEDKDQNSYLIDPFIIDPSKVSGPVLVLVEPVSELQLSPIESTPENQMTSKVYSRKKVAVPQLIQVQESKPTSRNEATVSHCPLQT